MAKNVLALAINKVGKLNKTSVTPSLIAVYVLMVILFTSITPRFFSLQNFSVIFATLAISGIVSVGLTPVIISGVFDMSIGSIFGLTVVVVAKLFNIPNVELPIILIILIGLSVGVIIGSINGFLVTKIGVNSIIVTLGTLTIFRGLTFFLSLNNISIPKEKFLILGRYFLFNFFPLPFILFIVFLVGMHLILNHTRLGRNIYLSGANPAAAVLAGINVKKTQFSAFLISGIVSAFAGVINAAQVGFANATFGVGYEFKMMTIVLLGGVSLKGGRGTLAGVLVATFIVGSISNGLALIDVPINWRDAVIGAILVIAILVDSLKHRIVTTSVK
jgi:ribose transport system permease protein